MVDIAAILSPIEGENPAGESLRYTPVYDDIGEARKEDDALDRGDWDREIKTADWHRVLELSAAALIEKSKDLQIAVWLTEALVRLEGFTGLLDGLNVINGLLSDFWDHFYPEIEDDDLDYRIGPLEFMNEKMWLPVKQIPLTDPRSTQGYSLVSYQESQQIGSEADDSDDDKVANRRAKMAEGTPSIEQFETAVAKSSKEFYKTLKADIDACLEAFERFDHLLDERFGNEAPRTAEFKEAIEGCSQFVAKILKAKLEADPDPKNASPGPGGDAGDSMIENQTRESSPSPVTPSTRPVGSVAAMPIIDTQSHETAYWESAVAELSNGSLRQALEVLYTAAVTSVSLRSKTRFRLMMAQLCVRAGRFDLARPIAEELNTMLEELGLERWESPVWIADVMGVLYKCLSNGESSDDDAYRAEEVFKKITTIDVTKAMQYKS